MAISLCEVINRGLIKKLLLLQELFILRNLILTGDCLFIPPANSSYLIPLVVFGLGTHCFKMAFPGVPALCYFSGLRSLQMQTRTASGVDFSKLNKKSEHPHLINLARKYWSVYLMVEHTEPMPHYVYDTTFPAKARLFHAYTAN